MLNIAETIDKMVQKIPKNAELQIDLGLISPKDDPFENFTDVDSWNRPSERDDLYKLVMFVAYNQIEQTGNDDTSKKVLLAEMITLINRRLVLRHIVSVQYAIDDIPLDQLAIYAQIAEEGWVTRINEIARILQISEEKQYTENQKLAKLFG